METTENNFLKINIIPGTVIVLCGPTHSGKSTFLEYLTEVLNSGPNHYCITILSSDYSRESILRELSSPYHIEGMEDLSNKFSDKYSAMSGPAFKALDAGLDIATSFPVNSDYVIIDSTAFNKAFRSHITKLANERFYNTCLITFEYKAISDYLHNCEDRFSKRVRLSVQKFRRDVLPSISSQDFFQRIRVNRKTDFPPLVYDGYNLSSNLVDGVGTEYKRCRHQSDGRPYVIIGDSHECTEELKELREKCLDTYPDAQVVHIGDYLNKGLDTTNMIQYIESCVKQGDILIIGNHESYTYSRLKGFSEPNLELENKQIFSSIETFLKDEDLTNRFFNLFEQSLPYLIFNLGHKHGNNPVYVTHAPCVKEALGKHNRLALREQRRYRIKDRSLPIKEDLGWFYEDANVDHPLHIIGHVAHKPTSFKGHIYKNKVFIDTGAVHGNKLTAVVVIDGRISSFISVDSKRERRKENLVENLGFPIIKEPTIDQFQLEPSEIRLLENIKKNNIRFISGTMSPGPVVGDQLEELIPALDWMKKAGANSVVLEPKLMGSRGTAYLFKDKPEKTFLTSRSGWRIGRIHGLDDDQLKTFFEGIHHIYSKLFEKSSTEEIILDGELMPWSTLGGPLIANDYLPYEYLVRNELDVLSKDIEFNKLTPIIDIPSKQENINRFSSVLNKFAVVENPYFVPFDILKGLPSNVNRGEVYNFLRKYDHIFPGYALVVDLDDTKSIEEGIDYFKLLTEQYGLEGVVVKPITPGCMIPYLKVRNGEYLRLIYGYDYTDPERYQRLCKQKSITKKLNVSIREKILGEKMLISEENDRIDLAIKLIGELRNEKELDPRL